MAFKLTPAITTGIPAIDRQHIELFDRINKLIDAISNRKASEEIEATINFLDAYIMVHLGTEEEYMLQYGYPGYAGHKKQHLLFRENVDRLKDDFKKQVAGSILAIFVQQWIGDWFVNHIGKVDMLYVPYLNGEIIT